MDFCGVRQKPHNYYYWREPGHATMKIAAPHSDFQDVRLRVEEPGEESQHSAPRRKLTK